MANNNATMFNSMLALGEADATAHAAAVKSAVTYFFETIRDAMCSELELEQADGHGSFTLKNAAEQNATPAVTDYVADFGEFQLRLESDNYSAERQHINLPERVLVSLPGPMTKSVGARVGERGESARNIGNALQVLREYQNGKV